MPIPHALRLSRRRALTVVVALGAAPLGLTPLALPVAATNSPPALTIVSTSAWNEFGHSAALHVVGEVRNDDATQTAQNIFVNCQLLTAGGALISEETTASDAEVLKPGEASPFDDLFLS